ncbi:cathepsin B [Asbolus verrucosus]|uniref:Cathepsin B n=1 Tax=Asbolus verrucosus TaxID=1661398 RepID=A0A482VPX8_ASBVE|nr:cathepsin B [Asbolus verrucosus]
MKSGLVATLVILASTSSWAETPILSDQFIRSINQKQSTWVAGRNFPENTPLEYLKRLNGALDPDPNHHVPLKVHRVIPEAIPTTFDARTNWPHCESIKSIRNQGNCGSCWAFGAASAITDRLCIATDGAVKFEFSAEDLVACCKTCGDGCDGGYTYDAWGYWVTDGIVSGGDYNSNRGCQPYSKSPFLDHVTPVCKRTCSNTNYGTPYSNDKHYGVSHYILEENESQIQMEILTNGPVEVSYTVYEDFYSYQSGVYQHTYGNKSGSHAVKVLGWGVEDGTPYWLVANSWGSDWGSLGGFFKILRGVNHCGIKRNVIAGERILLEVGKMGSSLVSILVILASTTSWAKTPILSDQFIRSINQKQSTWVAGRNFPEDTPLEYLKRLNGALDPDPQDRVPLKLHRVVPGAIPTTFDARTNWPHCESIKYIRDQGNCGSCWAFGTASAITDRLCIATGGAVKFEFSAENLLACCTECGNGCDGGKTYVAWNYWITHGVVSGGDYNSSRGCQPYSESAFINHITPTCQKTCSNTGYGTSYCKDRRFGASRYRLEQDESQIQMEILTNGPLEVSYNVYDDFYNYQSGVYQHTYGNYSGSHAVKVLGWGVEDGTPYWLIANSWGSDWGSLGGFFKILRGANHCGIKQLISCCTECGHGCQGGSSTRAWDYWVSDGIVLGGDCYTGKGCQPYSESAFENGVTPECDKTCSNADYETRYSEDKHYGASHYKIESDVSQIQAEILANGPVEGSFTVYDDFFAYQTGVYQYTYGDVAGAHAIKILGWGVENDTPYWLVANSWGENWGGLGGFFKILRGEDHCGIENNINAGEPKL